MPFTIREITPEDKELVAALIQEHWGAAFVVSKRRIHYPHQIPGFIATDDEGRLLAVATYLLEGDECELVTLDSLRQGIGIGTRLLESVQQVAQDAGCRRLWLITTNDNLNALGFYQKRGFSLVAIHRNAMEYTRSLKPMIPLIGANGIPLRDEIELEISLQTA